MTNTEEKTKEITKQKTISSKEWGIYGFEKNLVIAEELKASIENNKTEKIIELFRDIIAIRSLIVWRGLEGSFLELVSEGFEKILNANNIKLEVEEGADIITFLQKKEISEEVIHLLGEIAYHQRNKELLYKTKDILTENRNLLKSDKAYFRALHTLATWKEGVEHDSEESLKLNMEVIRNIKESDPIFYLKAKTGMTYNKTLLPKQKVADFLQNSKELLILGDGYDAFRVKVEAARAMLDLARQQGVEDIAFESLDKAKHIALDSLKIAKDIGYSNLEIVASETLESIYRERIKKINSMEELLKKTIQKKDLRKRFIKFSKMLKGDKRKAESFQKRTLELREKYQYGTIFNKKYKEEYFKHAK